MKNYILVLLFLFYEVYTLPVSDQSSLVVSSTVPPTKEDGPSSDKNENTNVIKIDEMHIKSNISNRFAKTLVTSRVKNVTPKSQEATFSVVLPEKAFISEFVMEIAGKNYKAYVKEKQEAKDIYDKAVSQGQSAAHVAVSARDSNRFTVSVNVEPNSKATFLLTYEELLQRQNGYYELVLNIHPGQIVKNLHTEVHINESRPLKFVRTPSLRSGNEVSKEDDKLKPSSNVEIINSTSAVVRFNPTAEEQQNFAKNLGTKESDGLAGQFVVQYDVERDPQGGEVLLQDGYFVHFFAPKDLEPLPKQVIFVLDSSGSMGGRKMEQLKDAMKSILNELKGDNLVNIIEFESSVKVWSIGDNFVYPVIIQGYGSNYNYENLFPKLSELNIPEGVVADEANIEKAQNIVKRFNANGGTNIIGGLETALYLEKRSRQKYGSKYQPLIIFLTDGEPNVGMSSTDDIVKTVTKINKENSKLPIFSLSFGNGADKKFLRKLSLNNNGFARHIYEAADASLQLQEFFKQISSPLLSNVDFKYDSDVAEVTRIQFPIYFLGSELVVTGKYKDIAGSDPWSTSTVTGRGPRGPLILRPRIVRPVTSLERLWAYLTIRQILDDKELGKNQTQANKQALELALKYSFVTDVSSLVVVKPNATSSVDTENAADGSPRGGRTGWQFRHSAGGYGGGAGYSARSFQTVPHRGGHHTLHSLNYPAPPPRTTPYYSADRIIGGSASTPFNFPLLEANLPWLIGVLQENNSLVLPQGTFEIGSMNTTVSSTPECPKSPQNTSGVCMLLKDCPQAFFALTDFNTYSSQYFCPLDQKYAGVCCPKKN